MFEFVPEFWADESEIEHISTMQHHHNDLSTMSPLVQEENRLATRSLPRPRVSVVHDYTQRD